jgi:dynein light chain 4
VCKEIKENMDKQHGPYWHVIIGEGFSFEITRMTKAFLYMYHVGKFAILVYKC